MSLNIHQGNTIILLSFLGSIIAFSYFNSYPSKIFMGDLDYKIVKIPPKVINGWKCIGTKTAMLANLSDLPHEQDEMERISPFSKNIPYNWDLINK